MTDEQKLELGIEIVAAMKANCYGVPIEEGRELALDETETDRMEGVGPKEWEAFTKDEKAMFEKICAAEKARLHAQAMFIAEAVLRKMKGMIESKRNRHGEIPEEMCGFMSAPTIKDLPIIVEYELLQRRGELFYTELIAGSFEVEKYAELHIRTLNANFRCINKIMYLGMDDYDLVYSGRVSAKAMFDTLYRRKLLKNNSK